MLGFVVYLDPESVMYGTATGVFVYKGERAFQFHYNIHTPHCKGPRVSNTMSCIYEIKVTDKFGIICAECVDTDFSNEAFWYYTPDDSLGEEDRAVRKLMKSVQAYCRGQKYCERLRKTDAAHVRWENARPTMIR